MMESKKNIIIYIFYLNQHLFPYLQFYIDSWNDEQFNTTYFLRKHQTREKDNFNAPNFIIDV